MKSFEEEDKKDDQEFIQWLLSLNDNKQFEVWKHFEERANKLRDQLWSMGTWLMTLVAATLSFPLGAKFVAFPDTGFPIQVTAPIPVVVIALFGIALCFYAYFALGDIRRHIERNWDRAKLVKRLVEKKKALAKAEAPGFSRREPGETQEEQQDSPSKRALHGWRVLVSVGVTAFVAFGALILLAVPPLLSSIIWSTSERQPQAPSPTPNLTPTPVATPTPLATPIPPPTTEPTPTAAAVQSLHLLQVSLVYVNTLMIQQALVEPLRTDIAADCDQRSESVAAASCRG